MGIHLTAPELGRAAALAVVMVASAPFVAVTGGGSGFVAGGTGAESGTAALAAQDASADVMIAAGRWAIERLPSGSGGLDPHRSGAGKDGARVRQVAQALGLELTTLEEAKRCTDALAPSTCQLSANRLLAIGSPRIDGAQARVKVYAWHRSGSEQAPVAERSWELSLRQSADGWRVVSGG